MDSNKIIRSRLCHGDHVPASRHKVRARKHMHTDKLHTVTHTCIYTHTANAHTSGDGFGGKQKKENKSVGRREEVGFQF